MSLHGQSKDALAKTQPGAWRYDVAFPGWKCNMTDLQAAIGLVEMLAHQGGKQLHVSTHKRRCPDRDTCPHFAPECERAADHGFISHLVLSSEPLDGDNVWEELCPHEMIGVDARMQLQRFPPPASGGST